MSIRKVTQILALAVLVGVCSAAQTFATPIISIVPSTQSVALGTDPVIVDINISGLGATEEVGAYSIVLTFNSAVLAPSVVLAPGFVNDPAGTMGAGIDFLSGFGPAGTLTLFYTAEDFPGSTDEAVLKGAQGAGFTLARVNFSAIGIGLSALTLSDPGAIFLSDAVGQALAANAANGSVCVGAAGAPTNCDVAAVPEPGTIALIGTGLAALAVRRRRQVRSHA